MKNLANILLVSHCDFPTNSAVHIHYFANELVNQGFDCVVVVPYNKESISTMEGNLYKVTQYDEMSEIKSYFDNNQPPDFVHAWTPRECVRLYCNALSAKYEFRLIVHLEDNEESVTQRFLNLPLKKIEEENEDLISYHLSHPRKYQEFLNTADGATVIMGSLTRFIDESIPVLTVFPGVDTKKFYPRCRNQQLMVNWHIPCDGTIVAYTGNVHPANQEEVRNLYLGVGRRNQQGKKTVLIRTGIDYVQLLGDDDLWTKQYVVELGYVDLEIIPDILALADILVQPGESDDFNDYRFPSKIPEFLAMGKPVIIPKTNIAQYLQHLENAYILPVVNQETLPDAIDFLMNNQEIAEKVARGGLEFAQNQLNWTNSTKKLTNFYQQILDEKEVNSLNNALKRIKYYLKDLENQKQFKNRDNEENETLINLQSALKESQQEISKLQNSHHKLSLENNLLKEEIDAMKTSKFWQLRKHWFKLKTAIGLPVN